MRERQKNNAVHVATTDGIANRLFRKLRSFGDRTCPKPISKWSKARTANFCFPNSLLWPFRDAYVLLCCPQWFSSNVPSPSKGDLLHFPEAEYYTWTH